MSQGGGSQRFLPSLGRCLLGNPGPSPGPTSILKAPGRSLPLVQADFLQVWTNGKQDWVKKGHPESVLAWMPWTRSGYGPLIRAGYLHGGGGGGQVYDHWARLESRADREGHGPWNTSHRGLKCRQLGSAQPWARHLTLSAKS